MSALLHDYATRAAEARGDAVALAMGDERLTYAELAQPSDRLAARLARRRLRRRRPHRPAAGQVPDRGRRDARGAQGGRASRAARHRRARRAGSRRSSSRAARAPADDGAVRRRVDEAARASPVWSLGCAFAGDRVRTSVPRATDLDTYPAARPRRRTDDTAHILFTSGSTGSRRASSSRTAT